MIPLILAPLLASLAKEGLGMLGQAVLAKGKDAIEEKLGVDLSTSMQTEEGIATLKNLQIKHAEFLVSAALEEKRMDLDNTANARLRDMAITKIQGRNIRADMMGAGGVAVIIVIVYLIWSTPEINEYTKGIMTLVLGRFLGYMDNIFAFEFGATRSSQSKDITIKNMSEDNKYGNNQ